VYIVGQSSKRNGNARERTPERASSSGDEITMPRELLLRCFVNSDLRIILVGFLTFLRASVPVLAHHGQAAYDTTKLVTVQGTVLEFQYINPHVQIYIEVKDDKGQVQKWDGEAGNTLALHRHGWSSKTLKPGDGVTLTGFRTKSGTNEIRLKKVVMADGKELDPYPSD
jgi:hypothetical protein